MEYPVCSDVSNKVFEKAKKNSSSEHIVLLSAISNSSQRVPNRTFFSSSIRCPLRPGIISLFPTSRPWSPDLLCPSYCAPLAGDYSLLVLLFVLLIY
jgi:hypothetical protein